MEVLVKSGLPRADVELPDPRHRPDGGEPVPTGPTVGDFKGPSCPGHAHPIAAQGRFTTGLGERHGAGRRAVIVMNQHTSLAPSIT